MIATITNRYSKLVIETPRLILPSDGPGAQLPARHRRSLKYPGSMPDATTVRLGPAVPRQRQRLLGRRAARCRQSTGQLFRHHLSRAAQIGIEVLVLRQSVANREDPLGIVGVKPRLEDELCY